jgi:hypothetical protein
MVTAHGVQSASTHSTAPFNLLSMAAASSGMPGLGHARPSCSQFTQQDLQSQALPCEPQQPHLLRAPDSAGLTKAMSAMMILQDSCSRPGMVPPRLAAGGGTGLDGCTEGSCGFHGIADVMLCSQVAPDGVGHLHGQQPPMSQFHLGLTQPQLQPAASFSDGDPSYAVAAGGGCGGEGDVACDGGLGGRPGGYGGPQRVPAQGAAGGGSFIIARRLALDLSQAQSQDMSAQLWWVGFRFGLGLGER